MNFIQIFLLILTILVVIDMIYLSIEDYKSMEISYNNVLIFTILLLIINFAGLVILGKDNSIQLWSTHVFNPYSNLMAGLLGGGCIAILVILSKENAMGQGDIFLAAILGFILGIPKIFVAFYIIIFSALIFGLILGLKQKKIKGLRIPLVPFITFGLIITLIFWESLSAILTRYLTIF